MTVSEKQEAVFNLLKDLKGLDPLKQLFWSELNYERINQSLSRRGWTDTAAQALADDPVLFASGGQQDLFHVTIPVLRQMNLVSAMSGQLSQSSCAIIPTPCLSFPTSPKAAGTSLTSRIMRISRKGESSAA